MSKKQQKEANHILPNGEWCAIDAESWQTFDAFDKCLAEPNPNAGGGLPPEAEHLMLFISFEPNDERKACRARDALRIWPDCAAAYIFLAEQTRNRTEALGLYEQGVAAGARALEGAGFPPDRGDLRGVPGTFPYMLARLGLAQTLCHFGRLDEAVEHLRDMLRLDPHDIQRARYTLASSLLKLGRNDELAELLQRFPDEKSAAWAYTKALLCFRQDGDTSQARQFLVQARKTNKYVPRYLLGDKDLPTTDTRYYWPGEPSEAHNYADKFGRGWKTTAGAIDWLRDNIKKKAGSQPLGPVAAVKNQLTEDLPQEYDVWQVDFRRLPTWIRTGDKVARGWVILVTSRSTYSVLALEIETEAPSAARLWDVLAQAMRGPSEGEAHRPTELQVRPDPRWESLVPDLDDIGVGLVVEDELDFLHKMYEACAESVYGRPRPGLLKMPGITPEKVGSYYAAAARFFRLAPWLKFGSRMAIKVECRKFQSGPWYAILMGPTGPGAGLVLCEDWPLLQRGWTENLWKALKCMIRVAGMVVTFEEEPDVSIADVDACKGHGWDLARPDVYPVILRKERGLSWRRPLAWELELVEGCLRAIPDFRERRENDDPAEEEMIVPVASGHLRMVLSWATIATG